MDQSVRHVMAMHLRERYIHAMRIRAIHLREMQIIARHAVTRHLKASARRVRVSNLWLMHVKARHEK
jgi:hypothetical protein